MEQDIWLPDDFYAQVILTITDHAPLLADPGLARQVIAAVDGCAAEAPGQMWAYVVLPDSLRMIVGPAQEDSLERFVETVKTRTSARLLDRIRRADDESLDAVLRYNPVWGGAIYQVWQAGSHRAVFWSEYKLSNAIYELRQAPVEAGLVEWPFVWIGAG